MNELQHACGALGQGGTEDVARCCGQSPVDAERHEVPDRLESRAKSKHMLRPQILRPKSHGLQSLHLAFDSLSACTASSDSSRRDELAAELQTNNTFLLTSDGFSLVQT